MKKALCVLLAVVLFGLLAACGNSTCALCNEKKDEKMYKIYHPYLITKQEVSVCEDCYNALYE